MNVFGEKQLIRPSYDKESINVSIASSLWWPKATLLHPSSFALL